MEKCRLCEGYNLTRLKYDNHLNKIKFKSFKHLLANAVLPYYQKFDSNNIADLKSRMIFSPLHYLIRCNTCGYGIYDRAIEPNSLFDYYRTRYWQAKGFPSTQWFNKGKFTKDSRALGQYQCVKNWIEKLTDLSILEIGAGSALFTRLLMELTADVGSFNVIESGNGWESYYKNVGINLVANYFPNEIGETFNYIHTSHWLEHTYNLNETITNLKKLLRKGGFIFVEVPNCIDDYYSLDVSDSPHIHFFTKESLRLLFEKSGFLTLTINEYGLTCNEEYKRRLNQNKFDKVILTEADESIKNNIPRKNGDCLRGLFQLK